LQGPADVIAEVLRAYARTGVADVRLVVDPIGIGSLERLSRALELLDRG
jgi:hypothetical protein